jgi:hypothetical protein
MYGLHSSVKTEEGVAAQLLIGHARLMNGQLLYDDPASLCDQCGIHLTVLHMLQCSRYDSEHQTFHRHGKLWVLLGDDLGYMTFLNGKGVNKYPTLL